MMLPCYKLILNRRAQKRPRRRAAQDDIIKDFGNANVAICTAITVVHQYRMGDPWCSPAMPCSDRTVRARYIASVDIAFYAVNEACPRRRSGRV